MPVYIPYVTKKRGPVTDEPVTDDDTIVEQRKEDSYGNFNTSHVSGAELEDGPTSQPR
jgi:hypothetical protein